MRYLKRILAVILVLATFFGSVIGSYALFSHGTHEYNAEDLSAFDDGESRYYLQRADKNIIFQVDTNEKGNAGYALYDDTGAPITTKTERVLPNSFNILPPDNGYEPGKRYTLSLLENAKFHDENLSNARELVFCIARENISSYKFADSVIETSDEIDEIDGGIIRLSDDKIREGDIIFGKNNNEEYVAYKIEKLLESDTATVSIPAIDEIYSELEVYGEYDWDINSIVANPDLEIEIIENVKKSSFVDELFTTAYAAYDAPRDGKFDVKITPDNKNNSIEIEITITLEPGEYGLFGMSELRNQQVSITLKAKLGLTTKCNIQGVTNWDVSASVTTGLSWTVSITLYTDEWKKNGTLGDLFSEQNKFANFIDYQKKVKKITEELNRIASEASGGEIKLFDWKLPVPSVPGLYFSAEIKLFAKFEMAADIIIGQSNETVYTVGVCFVNWKFETYSNTYKSGNEVTLSLRGKAKAKAGVKLVIKATLIHDNVANINLDPQVGLYAELYVTMPILGFDSIDDKSFIYSYFEPGVYFSCNINATLNVLFKKFEFSYELVEKKFPIEALTLGNKKIAIGLSPTASTVRAVNNTATVPDIIFEYLDVKHGNKATEKVDQEKLKFSSNEGSTLKMSNGKLTLPNSFSSSNCYVTATYMHTDNMPYSTMFRVLVSGSLIEGQVSAYDDNYSIAALEGAVVKLYANNTQGEPINTTRTDENGKFSFNVSEGNYKLVISAEGYRTLTSNQYVGADEIKYTEHILLMDGAQSGSGSAGGHVTNAMDGRGLSNVKLKLRADWNSTSGAYYPGFETMTDSSGAYKITGVPVGYYTVEAEREGYVTGHSNIIVLGGEPKNDFDFSISPQLSDDNVRIVLTWGATPSDLDSHLIGRTPSDDTFNVYYNNKLYRYDGVEMANLDVDDTTSYGPETVTILQNIYGAYTYAVHNYSDRSSTSSKRLSDSEATVKVFIGSAQVAEYHVPADQIGTYWTVFQIDGSHRIIPINTVSNTKPAA